MKKYKKYLVLLFVLCIILYGYKMITENNSLKNTAGFEIKYFVEYTNKLMSETETEYWINKLNNEGENEKFITLLNEIDHTARMLELMKLPQLGYMLKEIEVMYRDIDLKLKNREDITTLERNITENRTFLTRQINMMNDQLNDDYKKWYKEINDVSSKLNEKLNNEFDNFQEKRRE